MTGCRRLSGASPRPGNDFHRQGLDPPALERRLISPNLPIVEPNRKLPDRHLPISDRILGNCYNRIAGPVIRSVAFPCSLPALHLLVSDTGGALDRPRRSIRYQTESARSGSDFTACSCSRRPCKRRRCFQTRPGRSSCSPAESRSPALCRARPRGTSSHQIV
jgi:hypothetical protein